MYAICLLHFCRKSPVSISEFSSVDSKVNCVGGHWNFRRKLPTGLCGFRHNCFTIACDNVLSPMRRRQFWRTNAIVLVPHQKERVGIGNGETRGVQYVGHAPRSPAGLSQEEELFERITEASKLLPEPEREVFNEIIDLIMETPDTLTPAEISKSLSSRHRITISETQVRASLGHLQSFLEDN